MTAPTPSGGGDAEWLRHLAASVAIPNADTKARLEAIAAALLAARRGEHAARANLAEAREALVQAIDKPRREWTPVLRNAIEKARAAATPEGP